MRAYSLTLVAIAVGATGISGCHAQYPPPPGYVDECYGGDFGGHLNGQTPKATLWVTADPGQWPQVKERLQSVGSTQNLKYFDVSVSDVVGLQMIGVSLCSSRGAYVSADKRLWNGDPIDHDPHRVRIDIYQYSDKFNWSETLKSIEASFAGWRPPIEMQVSPSDVRLLEGAGHGT
jgi:hypothetical protein